MGRFHSTASSKSTYRPISRRPIAQAFRKTAHGAVDLCVRWTIHPDAVSYMSIVASALAAICFWKAGANPCLLLAGPLLCYLRLWFNMLDGMVAIQSGNASRRGEILNDLPDRISDILVFAGVAHSGLNSPFSGYWAGLFALLTAYVGMLGQAVGVQREFSGVMSKPWRMAVLSFGAWITLVNIWWGDGNLRFGRWTMLDLTCLVVIAGCVQTIWIRLARIMRVIGVRESAAAIGGTDVS